MAEVRKLFFALWPDDSVREGLLGFSRALPAHGGRPPHPEDLHITLVFLGLVTPEQYPCVIHAADAVKAAPFSLAIDRVGYWQRPRILWCGPGKTPEDLTRLVLKLQQGLKACGFQPEKRAYSPHVTLARKARPVAGFSLERPLEWRPREFALVLSQDRGAPPRYRVLQRWPLDGKKVAT